MKFSSLIVLVLAIAFTVVAFTFFVQGAKIGGPNAMPLCGWAIVWGIAAAISWGIVIWKVKNNNI